MDKKDSDMQYVFPLVGNLKHSNVFLDGTEAVMEAKEQDRKRGYESDGPNTAIVLNQFKDYIEYISLHATLDNVENFATRHYKIIYKELEY